MNYLLALITASVLVVQGVNAESKLLESVKRNPEEANTLCQNFKKLNSNNISSSSKESLSQISQQKNISLRDAEVLTVYVRALYCSETF